MRSTHLRPLLLTLLSVVTMGACRDDDGAGRAPAWAPRALTPDDPVVALVGGVSLFASDVKAQARHSGSTPRAALEDLIRLELLALAARDAGYQGDPDVREAWKAALVERMVEREYEAHMSPQDIPDSYLRRLYEMTIDQFVHPRLVRVGILSAYTGRLMTPEPRARIGEIARRMAARVAAMPRGPAEELQTVAQDPGFGGKASYTEIWQGADKPFSAVVGRAVAALQKPGDTTALIEDDTGFHIARYIAERAPENVPFETAREIIRPQAHARWRVERFLELTKDMGANHTVEANGDPFLRPRHHPEGG